MTTSYPVIPGKPTTAPSPFSPFQLLVVGAWLERQPWGSRYHPARAILILRRWPHIIERLFRAADYENRKRYLRSRFSPYYRTPPAPAYILRTLDVVLLAIARQKRSAAAACLSKPENWKLCESCDRLLSVERTLCPFCHGYHFSQDEVRMIAACCRDTGREPSAPLSRL